MTKQANLADQVFDAAKAWLQRNVSPLIERIKALEEATGTLLIRREKPCTATETGRRLVRHLVRRLRQMTCLLQPLRLRRLPSSQIVRADS